MYSPIKDANQDPQRDLNRLELVLDSAQLGIWDWYLQSDEVVFNKQWKKMLGYKMDEMEDTFETWSNLIHPDDMEETYAILNEHIENNTSHYISEHRLLHKDGEYRWILATGRVVERDQDGNAIRATGIHQNTTNRKNLEQKLKEEKIKSDRANRVKGIFIANMSHEIRTPISGVLGAAQLLLESENLRNDLNDRELIKIIMSSTNYLLSIVNDILDFSKMESGNLIIQKEQIDLNYLVSQIDSLFRKRIENKGLKFNLEVDNSDVFVVGDQKRLMQIVFNLLGNSIKFTSHGEIDLSIQVNNRNLFVMTFKDTGKGMSQEFLKKIWEPFKQEDDTKFKESEGTGLGTSIVNKLVSQMSGQISVESQLEVGSTFQIELPLKIIRDYQSVNQRRFSVNTNNHNRSYNKKVLLVEDNQMNSRVATLILEKLGVDVVPAMNGQEVLDIMLPKGKVNNTEFDLILMDSQLPIYDGETLTRKLREQGFDRPILAMTANVYSDDIERYLKAGMNDFIGKPYKIKDLILVLDKFLN